MYDVWVRGDQMDKIDVAGMWDMDYQFSDPLPDIIGQGAQYKCNFSTCQPSQWLQLSRLIQLGT